MIDPERLMAAFSDGRLAGLIARRGPAWACGADGTLVLANAGGLAALGAAGQLGVRLPETSSLRREVDRLLRVLPQSGTARLERLRLPGVRFAAVTAACRRLPKTPLGDLVAIASLEEGGDRTVPAADIASLIATIVAGPVIVADATGEVLARSADAEQFTGAAALSALAADAPAWIAEAELHPAARPFGGGRLVLQAVTLGGVPILFGRIEATQQTAAPASPVSVSEQPVLAEPPMPAEAVEPAAAPAASASVEDAPVEDVPVEDVQAEDVPAEAGDSALAADAPAVAPPVAGEPPDEASVEPTATSGRRLPLRFVWQTDAAGLLVQVSGELAEAVGRRAADVIGENLVDLALRLGFDPDGRIARALAKRDTWSGVNVAWPTDFGDVALVDLAGLPVFDRSRVFQGYRGFGVCRALRPAEDGPVAEAVVEDIGAAAEPVPSAGPATVSAGGAKVVPLRAEPAEARKPALSPGERSAFHEIGRMLGAVPRAEDRRAAFGRPEPERQDGEPPQPRPRAVAPDLPEPPAETLAPETLVPEPAADAAGQARADGERAVLERIPLAVLVYRGERILFANAALLDWTGHASAEQIERAGGLAALFGDADLAGADGSGKALAIQTADGAAVPVEARLSAAPWYGENAMVLVLRRTDTQTGERIRMLEAALRTAEASARELHAILNTATDGVVLTDRDGRILGTNGAAEALFGYDGHELAGRSFGLLFAPESQRAAFDYIDGLLRGGVASVLNDGREVMGRVREGGLIPLFMTMGRINEDGTKFCAVFRDITQWKRAEDELVAARRAAERASSHKSDFLAKISHEIRTPLNAIIGFSEVMIEERFGPIGNPRYKEYLKDIHTSGGHVVSLVNDLLDLSKIEAGKLDLDFVSVDLNDVLAQCMTLMQPQANRERIIIRTSLAPHLPPVVADARAMRQIVLNLLSNSIRFTQPGGQVILSTALSEAGEVVVRVRDTGVGMSEADIAAALEPFRQITTSGRGARGDGTGLGLPLTKALVEANRASFAIRSGVNAGTLVEVTFPPTRVLAE